MPHAEVAGAGFAGLAAALALARRGWSVRVHERAPDLRSEGFGIGLQANGLRVLDILGVREAAEAGGLPIRQRLTEDARGRVTSISTPREPGLRVSRAHLLLVLAAAARRAGVAIETGSEAIGATEDGRLLRTGHAPAPADLVLAADGLHSRIAASLGIGARRRPMGDGAMRCLVPRLESHSPPLGTTVESWSGTRRIIRSPVSAEEVYVALSCLEDDTPGRQAPLDPSWRAAFPALAPFMAFLRERADWPRVRWAPFLTLHLDRWSRGKVAILGDAAHAMPPNLGQGGGMALVNALALAVQAGRARDLPAALRAWEASCRPLTEHTQRWSRLYGLPTTWPGWARNGAYAAAVRFPWLRAQVQRSARHVPQELPA